MADTPAGGRKTKDREITDNFNPNKRGNLSKRELNKVKKDSLPDIPDIEDVEGLLDGDSLSFQILKDMRAAYTSANGKTKLKTMMGNDKDFAAVVKELLKVESALLSAKMKKDGDGGPGNSAAVFVIIKGLEDEKRVDKAIKLTDTGVDLEQVMNALNPNAEKRVVVEEKVEGPETW
ncbi:MAG TPA: hypothetical protein ACFYEK_06000 [Candidatus Wunengus sp. YC60]|uniref:hypothetical protein n=1 Tax=Candidatus Wunengus sp. YC60 TaxID=3367697 RepID=UPI004025882C